jgi:SAM-dependent methyltransferase
MNVDWQRGDALELLRKQAGLDIVFSSWVLGYIPFVPFLEAATRALVAGGQLAFVVHRQHSPREPLEIFWELVAADPRVLTKRVYFDFPRDAAHMREELTRAGLEPVDVSERSVNFHYTTVEEALEHLLKSGAGTAFYDALAPARRPELEQKFLQRLPSGDITHDYVTCLARTPSGAATSGARP